MQKMKVIILGAGGHGKVVADAVVKENKFELMGFADDSVSVGTIIYGNYKVICNSTDLNKHAEGFILAIGNNKIRAEKYNALKSDMIPVTIVHPFSSLASNVIIGEGTVILAGVVINASVVIGENCIINSKALVDHDSIIGNHSHLGQASVVGSGNKLDEYHHVIQNENLFSAYH